MFTATNRVHSILHCICRFLLGGLFFWSGLQKLGSLEAFYALAANYNVLPAQVNQFYAAALPWLEVMTGAYLLLGLFWRFTTSLACLLLLSFIIAIGIVLFRGDAIACGCFLGGGGGEQVVSWGLLGRDVLLLISAVYLFLVPPPLLALDRVLDDGKTA